MARTLLVLALLLLVAPAAGAQTFEERWRSRVREFERENAALPADAKTVVLLGSSSMEGWKQGDRVKDFLPAGHRYLNRGIGSDGVGNDTNGTGVLNRLESSAFQCKPGWIFLLIGQNNVGSDGAGVPSTGRKYRQIVDTIQARLPGVVLCLVTCQPTQGASAGIAPHLVALNVKIREIARDTGCPLIDLHAKLVGEDGLSPRPGLSSDGLHMTNAGYRLLGEEMSRVLRDEAPTSPPPTGTGAAPTPESPERSHLVKPGETLARIARRYGTTVVALARLNGITNTALIRVGRRLRLPAGNGLARALPGG
jgi:lysophospholipase L1-like esterase